MLVHFSMESGAAAPHGTAVVVLVLAAMTLAGCGGGECSRSGRAEADRYDYHETAPAVPVVAGSVGIDSVAVFCGRIEEVHRLWGAPDEIAPEDFFRVYDFHIWSDRGVQIGVDAAGRIDDIHLFFGAGAGHGGCFEGVTAGGLVLGPETREEDIFEIYGPVSRSYDMVGEDFRDLWSAGEPFVWGDSQQHGKTLMYPGAGFAFGVKEGILLSMWFPDCGRDQDR